MLETDSRVRAQMEALLLEPLVEPFAAAFGQYDAFAVQAFAQALARTLQAKS